MDLELIGEQWRPTRFRCESVKTSPRKCTVTGIDNHELPGLDVVNCATLIDTNHGIVNLIMKEFTYY